VHEFYSKNQPPTVPSLLPVIRDRLEGRFPYGEKKLRHTLHEIGFKWKRNQQNLQLMHQRNDIVQWRRRYLRAVRKYRHEGKNIIFLDETWFCTNDTVSKMWQDLTVERNPNLVVMQASSGLSFGITKPSGRGKRLMIINAIARSGLVPNALQVFPCNSKVTPDDPHAEMNAKKFERWFADRLLPNIPPHSVIILDNASYHSRKSIHLPSSGRRNVVVPYLQQLGFFTHLGKLRRPNNVNDMKMTDIFALCKEFRTEFDKYAVDTMAEKAGHTVLRLPPYHCILNPIEKVWAYQKDLAKTGNVDHRVAAVQDLCESCFSKLPSADCSAFYKYTEEEEQKLWQLDGLSENVIRPVIIPLYSDSDSDTDSSSSSEDDMSSGNDDDSVSEYEF
jgi:transposase